MCGGASGQLQLWCGHHVVRCCYLAFERIARECFILNSIPLQFDEFEMIIGTEPRPHKWAGVIAARHSGIQRTAVRELFFAGIVHCVVAWRPSDGVRGCLIWKS